MNIRTLLFAFGIFLILTNVYGLFFSLRNPDIYDEPATGFRNDITLTHDELLEQVVRGEDESAESFVRRVTDAVNKGIAHYWVDEGIEKYNLRIPFRENYLLWLAGYTSPENYRKYEFADYRKAMERGAGLCSQHAIIVTGILRNNGINARMIGLSGHVVLTAEIAPDTWYVADPDYGTVLPFSLKEIEENPERAAPYYREIGERYKSGDTESVVETVVRIFGREGNILCGSGIKSYTGASKYYREYASYILIWVIPLILLVPFLRANFRGKRV